MGADFAGQRGLAKISVPSAGSFHWRLSQFMLAPGGGHRSLACRQILHGQGGRLSQRAVVLLVHNGSNFQFTLFHPSLSSLPSAQVVGHQVLEFPISHTCSLPP
jgi:hypothetical protein